jgi:hypothetical protein
MGDGAVVVFHFFDELAVSDNALAVICRYEFFKGRLVAWEIE